MDFLDPLYARRHARRLYIGYGLVAVAIFLAVTMLLLIAYGFQLNRNGQVIQNGLLFASSRPTAATVFIDGVTASKQTNTRLNIPEGSYELSLKRDGYREWRHRIEIVGGRVFRYDYPLLFPETLSTTTTYTLDKTTPGIMTQSPDHRWLLLQQNPALPTFLQFDLKAPKIAPVPLTIPAANFTAGGAQSWQVVQWASDNVHLMLKHGYGNKQVEYVLLNRDTVSNTVNVSTVFKTQTQPTMIDSKYDQYYLYSPADKELSKASLSKPALQEVAQNVLAFEPFKTDTVLYVAPMSTDASQVAIHLRSGDQDYTLRTQTKATSNLIAINDYSGNLYVAIADPAAQVVHIYRNPLTQLTANQPPLPSVSLKFASPSFLRFSAGGRFILAERGKAFATYDAEYKKSVYYNLTQPLDAGQTHADWLDGAHLQYVSNKQLYVFDYDGENDQLLVPATVGYQALYDSNYSFVYALAPPTKAAPTYVLTSTSLRTPADQ